ncbi:MAG: phosphate acyltransferase, partial [Spirochaetaceae bacterium]
MHTGDNIKRIRAEGGIEIEELAAEIEVEPEYLSQIENGEEEAPVSILLKLASALGTDLSALIYGKEFTEKSVMVTDVNSRMKVERKKDFDYENLAPYYSGKHIEPFLVDVYPTSDDKLEYSTHEGEEFHYVMEGTVKIVVDGKEHILNKGDSIYYDSSLPHALSAVDGKAKLLAAIYNSMSMSHLARSKKMNELIAAAKHLGGMDVVVVIPNETAIGAVNRAMEERVIQNAFLVGAKEDIPEAYRKYKDRYKIHDVPRSGDDYEMACAMKGVELIRDGEGQMFMKGNINTAVFMKAVLNKEKGIGTGRRLSLVAIFELPELNRFVFLTDPGINPELTIKNDIETSKDIIYNAIDVAKSMGVNRPKIAILDANEKPSDKIPTSMIAQQLTQMDWGDAIVEGPLSYDLALYEESAHHKGITDNPVAGKADILIVPHLSGGNFLYKSWAMTMGADVANIVLGAQVPLIITSRSDSDMTKFLTLCASAVYSGYRLE